MEDIDINLYIKTSTSIRTVLLPIIWNIVPYIKTKAIPGVFNNQNETIVKYEYGVRRHLNLLHFGLYQNVRHRG